MGTLAGGVKRRGGAVGVPVSDAVSPSPPLPLSSSPSAGVREWGSGGDSDASLVSAAGASATDQAGWASAAEGATEGLRDGGIEVSSALVTWAAWPSITPSLPLSVTGSEG